MRNMPCEQGTALPAGASKAAALRIPRHGSATWKAAFCPSRPTRSRAPRAGPSPRLSHSVKACRSFCLPGPGARSRSSLHALPPLNTMLKRLNTTQRRLDSLRSPLWLEAECFQLMQDLFNCLLSAQSVVIHPARDCLPARMTARHRP